MLHITCDLCGKAVQSNEDHYIVKIEVFAAHDPAGLTEADLDDDHMEAISELLRDMQDVNDPKIRSPARASSATIFVRVAARNIWKRSPRKLLRQAPFQRELISPFPLVVTSSLRCAPAGPPSVSRIRYPRRAPFGDYPGKETPRSKPTRQRGDIVPRSRGRGLDGVAWVISTLSTHSSVCEAFAGRRGLASWLR